MIAASPSPSLRLRPCRQEGDVPNVTASKRARRASIVWLVLVANAFAQAPKDEAAKYHNEQDHRMQSVLWTQTSLENRMLCAQAYKLAQAKLREGLSNPKWSAATEQGTDFARKRPAVILDVDETVLDNSPFNARLVEDGTGYDPAKWDAWCAEAKAKPIPGAKEFILDAHRLGVEVFFVTNRDAKLKQVTATNLAKELGIAIDSEHLLLKNEKPEWTSKKTARRAHVAKTHRILLLIGDDFNDFVSLGDKKPDERVTAGKHFSPSWGHHWILLPNPTYGSWEKSIYSYDFDRSELEQIKIRHALLQPERE